MTTWIIRLHAHDERALHAMVLRRHPRLDRVMHPVTHLGDAAVTIGVTLMLALGAVPALRDAGARAAFALVASHAVVQLLKRTVTRARPRMPEGFAALVQPPDRFSFPSGHAASSLSVALAVAAVLRRPRPPHSWRWPCWWPLALLSRRPLPGRRDRGMAARAPRGVVAAGPVLGMLG